MRRPVQYPSYVNLTRDSPRDCKRCGRSLTLAAFYEIDAQLNFSRTVCLECHAIKKTEDICGLSNYKGAPKSQPPLWWKRAYMRHRNYGVTPEQFQWMLVVQDCKCPGCNRQFHVDDTLSQGRDRTPCVDHDHKTGKVRGLLCCGCNASIGHAKDCPETLDNLATYLRSHEEPGDEANGDSFDW